MLKKISLKGSSECSMVTSESRSNEEMCLVHKPENVHEWCMLICSHAISAEWDQNQILMISSQRNKH